MTSGGIRYGIELDNLSDITIKEREAGINVSEILPTLSVLNNFRPNQHSTSK